MVAKKSSGGGRGDDRVKIKRGIPSFAPKGAGVTKKKNGTKVSYNAPTDRKKHTGSGGKRPAVAAKKSALKRAKGR